jgi:uncharacterized protein (DUF1800 family)
MLSRWREAALKYPNTFLTFIGRYGDVVDFATLPPAVQTHEMAAYLGALEVQESDAYSYGCGSRNEVASDPTLGHRYKVHMGPEEDADDHLQIKHGDRDGKQMVWTTVMLSAPDQLRQRVAFALSQILVIGESGLGKEGEHELWVNYYDIFVTHAFGNYRDCLTEVSYSPVMAHYLTFHGNQALHVGGTQPDENFSRGVRAVIQCGGASLHVHTRVSQPPSMCCFRIALEQRLCSSSPWACMRSSSSDPR